jgi:hypothetical protein
MAEKTWGKTVLGWFVVQEDGGAAPSAADAPASGDAADALIAKYASGGSGASEPPPVELKGPLPPVVEGQVEFAQVYEAAGVDAEEQGRVARAQELLRSLPAETPVQVKKQIVEASLKAFGVPTEKIIEAAVAEIEALESFIRQGQSETQTILAEGNQKIAELERQIAEVRTVMERSIGEQGIRTKSANQEKLKIQQVLEFFGQEAVAQVVRESARLHEPAK